MLRLKRSISFFIADSADGGITDGRDFEGDYTDEESLNLKVNFEKQFIIIIPALNKK